MDDIILKWDLTHLFKNDEVFYQELNNIKNEMIELQTFKEQILTPKTLQTLLDKVNQLKEKANYILMYGSLRFYEDCHNEQTIELKSLAEKFYNEVTTALYFVNDRIISLGKDTIIDWIKSNPGLIIYQHYMIEIFRSKSHLVKSSETETLKIIKNNISDIQRQYSELVRSIKFGTIAVDNKEVELTPANSVKYLTSEDRLVRKAAYEAISNAYMEKSTSFAEILNQLYYNRTAICTMEKFPSVVAQSLFSENIPPEIITVLVDMIHKHLPIIHRYLDLRAQLTNIEQPHLYDFHSPINSNLHIHYSLKDALQIIRNALLPLGQTYLKAMDEILHNHYVDASLNETKNPSMVFSWSTFAFLNFHGSYGDLKNLAHELGHVINAYFSKQKQPYLYEDSTIFIGEIASKVNEILLNQYLAEHASNEDEKLFYLSKQIENYFAEVYKQTLITEFENILYTAVEDNTPLSTELLNQTYFDLVKQYYGPHVVYDDCTQAEWARLGHLYRHSYYNYTYATGLLIASHVVSSLTKESEISQDSYIEFLSSGSSMDAISLLQKLKINLADHSVINQSMKVLEHSVDQFEKILTKK